MNVNRFLAIAILTTAVGAQMSPNVRYARWAVTAAMADPSAAASPGGLEGQQQRRELQQEKFLHEHSDATGQVRPDLWQAGIDHVHQMKVAPALGAHPPTAAGSPSSAPTR